jgi:RNA polymerase sigma-70 factor (ECF subfamily)
MAEALFESLVSMHYEGLYRFALSLGRRGEEAADLTQETFYRYATKGSQLRDPSKAKSWLYTTLYRQFLMGRRRETRFPHTELVETEPNLPVVEPASVNRLDSGVVLEALDGLDETYRAPLALFYLGDHSYKEIAAILDVPIGTVMSRLSRAKSMLRGQLTASMTSDSDKIISVQQSPPTRSSAL